MQKYEDLEPKKVFYWFKQLNDIPRGSGNEKAFQIFWLVLQRKEDLKYTKIILTM